MRYIDALNAKIISDARKKKREEKAATLWPKKIKRKKLSSRKKVVRDLDSAFSLEVRAKAKMEIGHCAFCSNPIEHCFHFVTRGKHSVRWDFRNATGSCAGCNYRYEFDPHFAITWYINRFGVAAYEKLVSDGNKIAKFSTPDLRDLLSGMICGRLHAYDSKEILASPDTLGSILE